MNGSDLHTRLARWMYRSGRPNRVAATLNRGWAAVGAAGLWPGRMIALEVVGRRSGRTISFPVADGLGRERAGRRRSSRDQPSGPPGGRPHLAVDRGAPLADFDRIAADYPVFRMIE